MATRNKIFLSNEIYFLTFTVLDWRSVFISERYTNLVYKWFDYMKENYGNKIHGYVIMPNHIHLLVKVTERSQQVPKLIQNAKRFLAYEIVKYLKEDGNNYLLNCFKAKAKTSHRAKHKVFKDGYDSLIIQSRKFFLEKLNYIHKNPCVERWNLAKNPEDYPYSSAANYIMGSGVYPVEVMDI